MNKSIAKKKDKLRLSVKELIDSEWSKIAGDYVPLDENDVDVDSVSKIIKLEKNEKAIENFTADKRNYSNEKNSKPPCKMNAYQSNVDLIAGLLGWASGCQSHRRGRPI